MRNKYNVYRYFKLYDVKEQCILLSKYLDNDVDKLLYDKMVEVIGNIDDICCDFSREYL